MFLTFVCLISAAAAFPASVLYDRRQDGELNISADVENIVFLVAIPNKMSVPFDLFDLLKSNKGQTRHSEAQDRADHVMEAFVEPNTPYQVDIGSDRSAEGGGRAVEVVIAGRRRLETEPQEDSEEIKLIGATEQCGPDRERDPVTLMCRFKKLDISEVKPVSQSSNSIQKEPVKESSNSSQKEPVKESSNSVQKEEKPQATPEVIPS
ncbi:Uncharacterized protein OBRU01_16470 [Operophtera brumata]|uniref:Uncharacterized protein n=1 Tax=Operophtera brumata TaxID=104452 RepID=A0A0L7L352_OPEBR|nr:Uncharacterized protein OBRU01_16470 [Operophtera brumata]